MSPEPKKATSQPESAPQPAQGASSTVLAQVERHGLATVLLLIGGYYIVEAIVNPMVETTRTFVSGIQKSNEELRDVLQEAFGKNQDHWERVWNVMEPRQVTLIESVRRMEDLEDSIDRLVRELELARIDAGGVRGQ